MSILILSESYDNSTNYVLNHLNQFRIPFIRINTDINSNNVCFISNSDNKFDIKFQLKGEFYSINDFNLIWARRGFFKFNTSDLTDKFQDVILSNIFESHIKAEMTSLKLFLEYFIENNNIYCIGNPSKYNINKLIVLDKAVKHGLNVPNTCVSKETKFMKNVFNEDDYLISKPISNCLNYFNRNDEFLITQGNMILNMEQIKNEKFYYSLFQKLIKFKFELRIFFIMDEYFCSAIFKDKENVHKKRMSPYKLPEDILIKLKSLMHELNLNTGSIDMLVDEDLTYYFLEINPCGQIEWLAEQCFPNLHYNIAQIIKNVYETRRNQV